MARNTMLTELKTTTNQLLIKSCMYFAECINLDPYQENNSPSTNWMLAFGQIACNSSKCLFLKGYGSEER